MKNIKTATHVLGVVLLSTSAAVAAAKPVTLKLNLPGKPTFARPEMAALLTAGPVTLAMTDERKGDDPAVVGAQREMGEDIYQWRSAQPVVPAVQGMASNVLGGWGVRLAPEAEFGLKLALTHYYVTEKSEKFGSTYLGDVRFKVEFVDRSGGVLWSAEAGGTSKRPGVDGRAVMCNEALSVALRAALANALAAVKLETATPAIHDKPPVAAAAAGNATDPAAMLADLTRLQAAGVTEESMLAYVAQHRLSRPLTVDEILRWKDAGIPDAAIKAARP